MIVIGSRAARHWIPGYRDPVDVDLIATMPQIAGWAKSMGNRLRRLAPARNPAKLAGRLADGTSVEIEIASEGSTGLALIEQAEALPEIDLPTGTARAVDLAHLWAIKRAHAYWPIHWRKTMDDLVILKDHLTAEQIEAVRPFYERRLAENEAKHGERFRARLAMSNDAFFSKSEKSIGRQIDHDRLHEIVAYGERPLFEAFKRDLSKASLDRDLFEAAPMVDRLRLVREEAMVIASERYLIPGKTDDPVEAYGKALQRICTNLTSGWFREFALDHWGELRAADVDFWSVVVSRANCLQEAPVR